MARQVNGKDLVVGLSVNQYLSLEELLQCSPADKRDIIHRLQMDGERGWHREEIDPVAFVKIPPVYNDEQRQALSGDALDQALIDTFHRNKEHEQLMKQKTEELHFNLGKQIYEMRKQLKFRGVLVLDKAQLLGYISAQGSANRFIVAYVSRAINFLHETAPRMNCGLNSPNHGRIMHTWSIDRGDSIILDFGYICEPRVKEIQDWFCTIESRTYAISRADTVQLQIEKHDYSGFDIRVVLWWD